MNLLTKILNRPIRVKETLFATSWMRHGVREWVQIIPLHNLGPDHTVSIKIDVDRMPETDKVSLQKMAAFTTMQLRIHNKEISIWTSKRYNFDIPIIITIKKKEQES